MNPARLFLFLPAVLPSVLIRPASLLQAFTGSISGMDGIFWQQKHRLWPSVQPWPCGCGPGSVNSVLLIPVGHGQAPGNCRDYHLITSAGGAGAMINHSGIRDAIELATENFHVHYILLAWLIACRNENSLRAPPGPTL